MTYRPPNPFCWDRLHHGYIGIALIIIGHLVENDWLMVIGILILIDDIIEHTITEDTPLRILYEKLIKDILPKCACEG